MRSGMADLFEMLQSRTFMQQLGYGLLKIGLVNLFPELKLLFRRIERGALETAVGPGPGPPRGSGAASATSGSEQSQSAPTSFSLPRSPENNDGRSFSAVLKLCSGQGPCCSSPNPATMSLVQVLRSASHAHRRCHLASGQLVLDETLQ